MENFNVAIIGGGLAGLTASIYLAREGEKVVVLEKSSRFGGRAITTNKNGVLMNLGAHALYHGEKHYQLLRNLELTFQETYLQLARMVYGKMMCIQYRQIFDQSYLHHYFHGRLKYNFLI